MAEIRLKIVGVHYATNPDAWETKQSTEEMELRTEERLRMLDKQRPRVILVPDPTNPADPKAIQARVKGVPLGYVARGEVAGAHKLFDSPGTKMVSVKIDGVDVRRRGWLWVKAELPEGCLLDRKPGNPMEDYWKDWKCSLPALEPDDAWTACREAEFVMEMMLPQPEEADLEELQEYMKVWTDKNLHDLSRETKQMRERYIALLRATRDDRLKPFADRLEKQCTAVCGDHRMVYRLEWWKNLQDSMQMERYWSAWQSRKGFHLWRDLQMVDAHLRKMPNNLYSCVGRQSDIFAALYYLDVPRDILWKIYTLLLLRERICHELQIPMKPLPEDGYGVELEELPAPGLTDARLVKAVEECLPYFWAQSSWAVVYCVCRDEFDVPDNMSEFEKRIHALEFTKTVYNCPSGTIQKALSNNEYMKKPIAKWDDGRARKLAMELKSFLEQSF